MPWNHSKDSCRAKFVIVGDSGTGKTSLLTKHKENEPPTLYIPTCFGGWVFDVQVGPTEVELAAWDTCGQPEYDRLRPLSYPDSHVIIITFALDDSGSLDSVVERWHPEVTHYNPGIPFLLVGTKKDLRGAPERHREQAQELISEEAIAADARQSRTSVSTAQGKYVALKIGAAAYLECSAITGHGVRAVIERAAREGLTTRRSQNALRNKQRRVLL